MRVPTNIALPPITAGRYCLADELNADKYMPFVGCTAWAQADFYKFSRERRNPSVPRARWL